MHRLLTGTSVTTDPLDALLGPAPTGTTPLEDFRAALEGRLGIALAMIAVVTLAWLVRRSIERRHRREWGQRAMIHSVASRGFALYRGASATPGGRVDARTPSWPVSSAPVAPDAPTLPAPDAAALQPPPWATWVRHERA